MRFTIQGIPVTYPACWDLEHLEWTRLALRSIYAATLTCGSRILDLSTEALPNTCIMSGYPSHPLSHPYRWVLSLGPHLSVCPFQMQTTKPSYGTP